MALDISSIVRGRLDGRSNFSQHTFVVTNGVTITAGDFVYFDGSGRVTNSSVATQLLVGMALQTVTGTTGTVAVQVCIDPNMTYLLKNDNSGTTFAATQVGTKFDLIGATGAQLVDTSTTGTSGQLVCLEYNPQIDPVKGDTTYGLFMVQESVFTTSTGGQ